SSSDADTIHTRSTISSAGTSPLASYFSLEAVSHQDLLSTFNDFNPDIINHEPLGVEVDLESYAWSHSFMESFVILDYTITNKSDLVDTSGTGWGIKNLFAGIWADASVNNMNYKSRWEPGSGFSWYDNINSFERSYNANGFPRNIGYQYDFDGDDGWSRVYFGLMALHGPNQRSTSHNDNQGDWYTYYNQWRWNSPENMDIPEFNMPESDVERYQKLSSSPFYDIDFIQKYDSEPWLSAPNSWMMLVSAGPFGSVAEGDGFILPVGGSVNVVFAVLAAPWSHQGSHNDLTRRQDLIKNADWAQKAFNGEDINGNSILDSGEDLNENGILDRYIVPEPPPSPSMTVLAEDQRVTLYWDNAPEFALDPVSRKYDFAGYRIYGSAKTRGSEEQYSLLADFDLIGDEFGYDTGFDLIRIKNKDGAHDSINIQGHYYHYVWVNEGVQNGWPDNTTYSITAYDSGDENTGLESLESSRNENRRAVVPGTVATNDSRLKPASVYPNPYRARASWDGNGQRDRLIWFRHLPEHSTIRIYTLGGDMVDEIDHNGDTYQGEDIARLSSENKVYAGGEHAWDLITQYDEPIATGMYVFTVENLNNNEIQVGKFLVIK
ncbi:MAG: hypothetical protein K9M49_07325, partial [Candidatus Marinimicrobia bacterium]|nr:hypothetical protein [Candidatus Neomarinimicrobiota bacterium]